jgi:cofilin
MTRGFATITSQCEEAFDQVKETDTLNYVIYKASAHDKKIDVASSGKFKDYSEFIADLPGNECLYSVCDFEYESPTGGDKRSKLVFITWYVTLL